MGYGVMVTLQILVLSFLVRVRVSQLRASFFKEDAFFCFICPSYGSGTIIILSLYSCGCMLVMFFMNR